MCLLAYWNNFSKGNFGKIQIKQLSQQCTLKVKRELFSQWKKKEKRKNEITGLLKSWASGNRPKPTAERKKLSDLLGFRGTCKITLPECGPNWHTFKFYLFSSKRKNRRKRFPQPALWNHRYFIWAIRHAQKDSQILWKANIKRTRYQSRSFHKDLRKSPRTQTQHSEGVITVNVLKRLYRALMVPEFLE